MCNGPNISLVSGHMDDTSGYHHKINRRCILESPAASDFECLFPIYVLSFSYFVIPNADIMLAPKNLLTKSIPALVAEPQRKA